MKNISEFQPATPESVWEAFRESDRQRKENERILNERFAETEKLIKENAEQMKESRADYDRLFKENAEQMKESRAEFDQRMRENDEQMKKSRTDYERRMKKYEDTIGAWSRNHGSFAEEYFFNSFENGKCNFFGEKFDEIEKNAKGINKNFRDEYDILLINCTTIGIIEVKFKAHKDHITRVLNKAKTFRENFPYYAKHKVYLGLASFIFTPNLEQECMSEGIAIVKQVGGTVIINDKHLKAY